MRPFEEELRAGLDSLERRALRRVRASRAAARFPKIDLGGRRLVNFAANDYLGLAAEPRVAEALATGARRWGAGAGAAHLLSGHTHAHAELEAALAQRLGREAALLFSTGYMANLGVVGALAGRADTVVEDRLNHASLIDAAVLARAHLRRYAHADARAAAARLETARGRTLLVTDGVFSMDGDIAPLPALAAGAARNGALLVVDDAHGFGVLGPAGAGTPAHFGLAAAEVPVLVVTLGKALGVFGAAVAGSRELIETLVQRARPWVYTTALPPAVAVALGVALELARGEEWRRERLRGHIVRFREGARAGGLTLGESTTPIQPVLIGPERRALAVSAGLAGRGYYVPAVRPPTVPAGSARLRVALSAAHSEEQVDGLCAALVDAVRADG